MSFDFRGQTFAGIVNRINKNITVLVEDKKGRPFSNGKTYSKYFVPPTAVRVTKRCKPDRAGSASPRHDAKRRRGAARDAEHSDAGSESDFIVDTDDEESFSDGVSDSESDVTDESDSDRKAPTRRPAPSQRTASAADSKRIAPPPRGDKFAPKPIAKRQETKRVPPTPPSLPAAGQRLAPGPTGNDSDDDVAVRPARRHKRVLLSDDEE